MQLQELTWAGAVSTGPLILLTGGSGLRGHNRRPGRAEGVGGTSGARGPAGRLHGGVQQAGLRNAVRLPVSGRRADLVREAKDRALRLGNRVLQGTQPDISVLILQIHMKCL